MDGLVVIWGGISIGLGIALLFLWRDTRPSEKAWDNLARRLRASDARMTASPKAVRFDEHSMWVELEDGRVLGVPLAWFPRLLWASAEERAKVEFSPGGLHWDALDEDICIGTLLAGRAEMASPTEMAT